MNQSVYHLVKTFKRKYPATVAWRLKAHCRIIEKHLNPGEKLIYGFACQKNEHSFDFFTTYAIVLTNKRLLIATKRIFFGYFFLSITPDMYNDLKAVSGIIWGKLTIDTIKEVVKLSNIQKSALPEVETKITDFMMKEKRKYAMNHDKHEGHK